MASNFLNQVALQYALDVQQRQDDTTDPQACALIDALVAELTDDLNADKFYEC